MRNELFFVKVLLCVMGAIMPLIASAQWTRTSYSLPIENTSMSVTLPMLATRVEAKGAAQFIEIGIVYDGIIIVAPGLTLDETSSMIVNIDEMSLNYPISTTSSGIIYLTDPETVQTFMDLMEMKEYTLTFATPSQFNGIAVVKVMGETEGSWNETLDYIFDEDDEQSIYTFGTVDSIFERIMIYKSSSIMCPNLWKYSFINSTRIQTI